jgi:hypothetical protein
MKTAKIDKKLLDEVLVIAEELEAKGCNEFTIWLATFYHTQQVTNHKTEFTHEEIWTAWEQYQAFKNNQVA